MEAEAKKPQDHEFREVNPQGAHGEERISLDDLKQVKMTITAHLGSCSISVRDVLALKRGAVVTLDKLAGEMTDIFANGLPLARGEVVVIADELHVRIGEIVGQEERSIFDEGHDDASSD